MQSRTAIRRRLLTDPFVFEYRDGYVDLPDGPGLGVEIDGSHVSDRTGGVDWHNPIRCHDDGSVAE